MANAYLYDAGPGFLVLLGPYAYYLFAPALILTVLLEALIVHRILPLAQSLRACFLMNSASGMLGLALGIVLDRSLGLDALDRVDVNVLIAALLASLIITLLAETPILFVSARGYPPRRILLASGLANLASYALMLPLFFVAVLAATGYWAA